MTESTAGPGDLIDLDITDVAHGGVFVGRHEGRVVFVSDAIPGERVRVRLTDTGKKSFWRGETLEVLDASPHRRAHVWAPADVSVPPADRPGGADFGHIDLVHQRELKLRVLRDALARIGGLADLHASIEEASPIIGGDGEVIAAESPHGTGWRTRLSLHVDDDGRVGPYAARSHRVIAVDDMPLATPAIEAAMTGLGAGRPGRIDLVQPDDGRVRILPRPRRLGRARGPRSTAVRETVIERAGGRAFRVDAGGFWQVHRLAAHNLVERTGRALRASGVAADPDAWHLDLYGGVGLLATAIADWAGESVRLTSVESDVRATEHAGENLAEWIGARAETERVDRWLARLDQTASPRDRDRLSRGVVVLDPPRSGAGRDVVESLVRLSPAAIVYVACDPVALARDLATFRDAGYEADAVHAVDLFPHSHHVEAVAAITRTGTRS